MTRIKQYLLLDFHQEREAEADRKKNISDIYSSSQELRRVARDTPLDDVAKPLPEKHDDLGGD